MMYAVLKLDFKHTASNPLDKVNVLTVRAENTVMTDWRELTINDLYCYSVLCSLWLSFTEHIAKGAVRRSC